MPRLIGADAHAHTQKKTLAYRRSPSKSNDLVNMCEDLFEREREAWLSTSMSTKLTSMEKDNKNGKSTAGEDEEEGQA